MTKALARSVGCAWIFVSEPTAINSSDQITLVAPNDWFGFTRAFLWDGGVFTDLSAFTTSTGLFALRPLDIYDRGEILVQLGDALGLQILDIVILRPVKRGPRKRRVFAFPRPASRQAGLDGSTSTDGERLGEPVLLPSQRE